jgi:uncharacterized protein (DUF305 family)
MQNTQRTYLLSAGFLVVGLAIGWLAWGRHGGDKGMQSHMMSDGTMMQSDGSDMSGMMANMNAALQGKTGDAFDQEFLSEMIVHHQGAIDMADLALTSAKHQEIKDLANNIIKAQTSEIEQMKSWQKTWYGK